MKNTKNTKYKYCRDSLVCLIKSLSFHVRGNRWAWTGPVPCWAALKSRCISTRRIIVQGGGGLHVHLVPAERAHTAAVQPAYNAILVELVSTRQQIELLLACRVTANGALGTTGHDLGRILPQHRHPVEEVLDSQHL